jgi:hypothetical protein
VAIEIIVLLTTAKEAMFICMLLFFHQCEVVGIIMGCWVLLLVLVLGGWWWRTTVAVVGGRWFLFVCVCV